MYLPMILAKNCQFHFSFFKVDSQNPKFSLEYLLSKLLDMQLLTLSKKQKKSQKITFYYVVKFKKILDFFVFFNCLCLLVSPSGASIQLSVYSLVSIRGVYTSNTKQVFFFFNFLLCFHVWWFKFLQSPIININECSTVTYSFI